MMKYLATKDNISASVLRLRNGLLDFLDYGMKVTAPNGVQCYGFVSVDGELPHSLSGALGLFPT